VVSDSTLTLHPAYRIFDRLLHGYGGTVALRLWDDTQHASGNKSPTFTLVVHDPAVLRRLALARNPLTLADAYFRGALDVDGDLYCALSLLTHFQHLSLTWRDKLALLRDAWSLSIRINDVLKPTSTFIGRLTKNFTHRHTKDSDRSAISFHYDVSNVSAPSTPVNQSPVLSTKSAIRKFQGSSASTASTLLAAGKSRSTRRSQVYGSKPLALAVCTKE